MRNYVNAPLDEPMPSSTIFTHDENGEQIIRTDFLKTLLTSESDVSNLGLEIGRALKGSLKVIRTPLGYGLKMRPFRSRPEESSKEPICTTSHGKLYRTGRHTRVVFEFPSATPLTTVGDMLDDEVYDMRHFIETEGTKC